jgi:hypothetical protein
MQDITETADLPEGFSKSLFPVPQPSGDDEDDDALMIDAAPPATKTDAPLFPPASAAAQKATLKSETRRVPIPPHRMTPLKKDWVNIFGPLTEILGLQVRMNVQRRCVEIRVRLPDSLCGCSALKRLILGRSDVKTHERHWCYPERRRLLQSLRSWIRRQCASNLSLPLRTKLSSNSWCYLLGRHCPPPIRRPLSRLLRNQGRQNPPRRPLVSSNRSYCRPRRQDQIHHRKRQPNAYRSGRYVSSPPAISPLLSELTPSAQ